MSKKISEAKRGDLWRTDPLNLVVVGLDTKDGDDHPLYDPRIRLPIDQALVESIDKIGIKAPVTVRRNGHGLEVIDGRRRVLHARKVNDLRKKRGAEALYIPFVMESGDEREVIEAVIALNELRAIDDMPTKAIKAKRMAKLGFSTEEIGRAFGASRTAIKSWIAFDELPRDVKRAVKSGKLSASAALKVKTSEGLKNIVEKTKERDAGKKPKAKKEAKKGKPAKPKKKTKIKVTDVKAEKIGTVETKIKGKAPSRKVLQKILKKERPGLEQVAFGIRLALGEWLPDKGSALGKALVDAGYRYS